MARSNRNNQKEYDRIRRKVTEARQRISQGKGTVEDEAFLRIAPELLSGLKKRSGGAR
jgi:hypothetical protein